MSEAIGPKLTDVVQRAYLDRLYVRSSGYARTNALYVAAAASMGLLTTHTDDGRYGNIWRVTKRGMEWLEAHQ